MPDEQNQQGPQLTTQEAGSATPGESVPSATGTASTQANPDRAPSNPAIADSPSGPLTEPLPASLSGSGSEEAGGAMAGEPIPAPAATIGTADTNAALGADTASKSSENSTAPEAAPAATSSGSVADAPAVAQVGEQVPSLGTIAFGSGQISSDYENGADSTAQTLRTKSAHHTALEELVGAIRKTFNLLGGELEAAVRKAEDLL